jgi:hypothetical protein
VLYDARLRQLADALSHVVNDFGGRGKTFRNTYPIRYPGTWDTTAEQRQKESPEKWDKARAAFLESELVSRYVDNVGQRWDIAMRDDDGGLSLISGGFRRVTTAEEKQNQLQQQITEVRNRLLHLARSWTVDPDANVDREKRIAAANRVLEWLRESEEAIYYRVHALEESLCFQEGDELQISDCADVPTRRHADPLPRQLRQALHEWATTAVPKRWQQYIAGHEEDGPWLDPNDLNAFVRYLRDFFYTDGIFDELIKRLEPIVNLKLRDEAARRRARRKFVRTILNDFVMNPGPSLAPMKDPETGEVPRANDDELEGFGLMGTFVRRWVQRLPLVLAAGGGEHVRLPPGNAELIEILEPFDK